MEHLLLTKVEEPLPSMDIKMKLNAPETWRRPTETIEVDDLQLGRVRVSHWSGYHFKQSASHAMEIIRVESIR